MALNQPEQFKGKTCTLHLNISEEGKATIIRSNGNEKLCKITEKVVKTIGVFPMPADKQVAKKLNKVKLVVTQ
ncbi:hypothetical protein BIT28_10250 [Photobacterium proteolyticum]|uniref:TonB C-terminal domain-containing protein n=1 Tax=Photobacterium proteolyticum TaxID=1903952 RepID=A0A1Q9G6K4_9GAMM|nr:cell envelope integrity TolA C-terminal domain-containing protein [Photobacterium proteolyticum]OLQ69924.1 hypothetical protein BIT28_10250 [Photobacterium proteolyticum]